MFIDFLYKLLYNKCAEFHSVKVYLIYSDSKWTSRNSVCGRNKQKFIIGGSVLAPSNSERRQGGGIVRNRDLLKFLIYVVIVLLLMYFFNIKVN